MDTKTPAASMQKLVEDGARYFEDIEKKLAAVHETILKLAPVWEQGNKLAMMGALETGRLVWKTKAVAGLIAEALAHTYELHQDGTTIAQKNDCDLPQPQGGGGGR